MTGCAHVQCGKHGSAICASHQGTQAGLVKHDLVLPLLVVLMAAGSSQGMPCEAVGAERGAIGQHRATAVATCKLLQVKRQKLSLRPCTIYQNVRTVNSPLRPLQQPGRPRCWG